MAIQDSAHVYATDFLREAQWTDKVRDQSAYITYCQNVQSPLSDSLPALVAVGRQMTIRSLVCRIEDHKGVRLPTNHICVWSQMTSLFSYRSILTALPLAAYIESLRLRTLARQAPVLIRSPSPDTCGHQDEKWRSPGFMASAFPLLNSPNNV